MPASQRPHQQTPPNQGQGDQGQGDQGPRGTSPLEWALAALSAALVLGVIGFLLYEGLAEPTTPPEVRVTVETVRPAGSGYLVTFKAENRGQRTAAGLGVEGTLKRGGTTVETRSTTLDYVPSEGARKGGLYFTEDPRDYELALRATGYDRP